MNSLYFIATKCRIEKSVCSLLWFASTVIVCIFCAFNTTSWSVYVNIDRFSTLLIPKDLIIYYILYIMHLIGYKQGQG